MEDLRKDGTCFVCGEKNPRGLKVKVKREERGASFEFLADGAFRGWNKYLHGGVIGLLFDELLGWTSRFLGYKTLTARLEVRYRKPVPVGSLLTFRGELEERRKNLLYIRTWALFPDGSIAAEGRGTMMIVGREENPSPDPL